MFFYVPVTGVPGRQTWACFHFAHLPFSFLSTMMGNIMLEASTPSWISDAVADRPKATMESTHFPTVSWLTLLISDAFVWR